MADDKTVIRENPAFGLSDTGPDNAEDADWTDSEPVQPDPEEQPTASADDGAVTETTTAGGDDGDNAPTTKGVKKGAGEDDGYIEAEAASEDAVTEQPQATEEFSGFAAPSDAPSEQPATDATVVTSQPSKQTDRPAKSAKNPDQKKKKKKKSKQKKASKEEEASKKPEDPYFDSETIEKLERLQNVGINQGNVISELLSLSLVANSYSIVDMDREVEVDGLKKPTKEPLFVVEEESSLCCRFCCCGRHPLLAKFYHANPPTASHKTCCVSAHSLISANKEKGVIMTLEREGCCSKWPSCFILSDKCVPVATMHSGEPSTEAKIGKKHDAPFAKVFGRQQLVVTCFSPVLEVFSDNSVAWNGSDKKNMQSLGYLEGPTCFGGCMEICRSAKFMASAERGREGDLGRIKKKRPTSFFQLCLSCLTDVDEFQVEFNPERKIESTVRDKANIISAAIHLDYIFFERDMKPLTVVKLDKEGKSGVCIINLCNVFIRGCALPMLICIPYTTQCNEGG